MKLNQKEINMLAQTLVDDIYDQNKFRELAEAEGRKAYEKFLKRKEVKEMITFLKKHEEVNYLELDSKFLWKDWSCNSCWDFYFGYASNNLRFWLDNNNGVLTGFMNWASKKFPSRHEIERKVRTELTYRMLWGEELKDVIDWLKNSIKKEFKL